MRHLYVIRIVAALISLSAGTWVRAATWPIEIDGKPVDAFWHALSDKPDTLAKGDVLYVGNEKGGMWLCVRETTNLSFVNHLDAEALLYRKTGDNLEAVGFSNSNYKPPQKVPEQKANGDDDDDASDRILSPKLSDLSAIVVSGLWGVHINWDEEPSLALKHVNPQATFCSVRHMRGTKRQKFSAPFAFRYLDLEWTAALDDSLYTFFAPGLVFLKFALNGVAGPLDATRLAKAADLRFLSYSFSEFSNHPALAQLTELRHLNLSYAENLTEVPWLSTMTNLRSVDFSQTGLATLSSFGTLQRLRQINISGTPTKELTALQELPALESLSVQFTAVEELPSSGFNKLHSLNAFSSKLRAPSLTAFRATHPQCKVQYEWKLSLLEAAKQTDRLVVRSGGTCHRNRAKEKVLLETKSPDEIRELLESIDINETESDSSCMCCGYPTLEFYQGAELLAMVGVQHGSALRWGPWPADGRLTPQSADRFNKWMTKHGIPDPKTD